MTCHMGEFIREFLWSSCDQCGTNAEFECFPTSGDGPNKFTMRDVRDEWNKHHGQCDAAKKIAAPPFTHEWDRFITYV